MKYYLIRNLTSQNYRIRDEKGNVVKGLVGPFWKSYEDIQKVFKVDGYNNQRLVREISEEQLTLYKLGASPEGDIDG